MFLKPHMEKEVILSFPFYVFWLLERIVNNFSDFFTYLIHLYPGFPKKIKHMCTPYIFIFKIPTHRNQIKFMSDRLVWWVFYSCNLVFVNFNNLKLHGLQLLKIPSQNAKLFWELYSTHLEIVEVKKQAGELWELKSLLLKVRLRNTAVIYQSNKNPIEQLHQHIKKMADMSTMVFPYNF